MEHPFSRSSNANYQQPQTFAVSSGISLASADTPATLPAAIAPGKPFKVGKKRGCAAFGAKLDDYATDICYGCEVPNVLLVLWAALVVGNGLQMQGIFRIAPDPAVTLAAEKHLNKGCLPPNLPPEVLAHLIKSFLRRLPGSLLGRVPRELIEGCTDAPGYAALREQLTPAERGVIEWLVRMICEVALHKDANSMGLRNLTLVLAPNLLFTAEGRSPKQRGGTVARGLMMAGLRKHGSGSSSPPSKANPIEELLNIELVSNALHTLAASSLRFRM